MGKSRVNIHRSRHKVRVRSAGAYPTADVNRRHMNCCHAIPPNSGCSTQSDSNSCRCFRGSQARSIRCKTRRHKSRYAMPGCSKAA